ncbi:RDD family protein [Nocardia barduliensis]|uniref:RDD family protein n=1 Tax=Nocardia barduliensis TaxID=2736643 RepID=UPI001FEBE7E0|nr:RDD family protein [Nocardia barduliensis]
MTPEGGEPKISAAPIPARMLAYLVDFVCPLGTFVVLVVLAVQHSPSTWWTLAWATTAAAVAGMVGRNRILRQGRTGRTWGRILTGTRTVVGSHDRSPGIPRTVLRETAHFVDLLPVLIIWLWPWRGRAGQSFADALAGTWVITDRTAAAAADRRTARRMALVSVVGFASALVLLCICRYRA